MARFRRPSPQTLAVLSALAASGEWTHGYELCGQLGLKPGTVYPILIRLAERGQVLTRWEQSPPEGRPARHLYRITDPGLEVVAQLASEAPTPTPARASALVAHGVGPGLVTP